MKHRITITLIVFCALFLGMGPFAALNTARAISNQIHVGVGVGVGVHPVYHRRHRRHHRRAVVIAPQIDIHAHDHDHDHDHDRH